ncbi:hypothetical protein GCM10023196_075890 [Actinoallomurus vinaceus]|uniref:CHAP domain-containing protein n=1 Tax=Actinoallomurus vinaceus TaxID=1080074 RepID=A0ABP8ULX9_9ACTN
MKPSIKTLIPIQLAAVALVGVTGVGAANAATHRSAQSAEQTAQRVARCWVPGGKQGPLASKYKKYQPKKDLHQTRAQILKRAQSWVTKKVPYSQDGSSPYCNKYGVYRRDCSGFVSMAWGLHSVQWTGSLIGSGYSKPLGGPKHKNWTKLIEPGDAVTRSPSSHSGHVALVVKVGTKGVEVAQEPTFGGHAEKVFRKWAYLKNNGFYGIRYAHVK